MELHQLLAGETRCLHCNMERALDYTGLCQECIAEVGRRELAASKWFWPYVPLVIPFPYRETERGLCGLRWQSRRNDGSVILSGEDKADGRRWLHLSHTRQDRCPTHEEMAAVKDIFLGRETLAFAIYPPRSRHISLHPTCLHLWSCIDGDPLPDFAEGGRSI